MGKTQLIYEGVIRGVVTGAMESSMSMGFRGVIFSIKLEEKIKGVPDEIVVRYENLGYFRVGDEVLLQGEILKIDLEKWDEPVYEIGADHSYNLSLKFGA